MTTKVDILKMRAKLKSVWVRKLIGKLGVPYNRRLRVRGSPHPHDYDADLSIPAAESNAFRAQALCERPEAITALSMACRSFWTSLIEIPGEYTLFLGTFGRPTRFFIKYLK
jgi:hypothetical protein